jgi:hypothetical protein
MDFLSCLSSLEPTVLFSWLKSSFLDFLFSDLDLLNPFLGASISSLDFTH